MSEALVQCDCDPSHSRSPPRPWSEDDRHELLDRLRAGDSYGVCATRFRRSADDCRAEAAALRAQGWTAIGAGRRMKAPAPSRRCLSCREPFAPRGQFIFRCDPCLEAGRAIAA